MILADNYKIIPKKGGLVPFEPNYVQKITYNILEKFPKVYILKGRQFGITTLLKLLDLDFVISNIGVFALTIADKLDNAKKIFKKVSVGFDNLPESFKVACDPSLDNVRELFLKSNQSGLAVDNSARSMTTQRLHLSEFAFFTTKLYEETMTGTLEALPQEGRVVIETTANGMNHGYTMWHEDCNIYEFDPVGKRWYFKNYDPTKTFVGVFLPFYWHEEYRLPVPDSIRGDLHSIYDDLAIQFDLFPKAYDEFKLSDETLFWYITKVRQNKNLVKREYPLFAEEAFLSSGKNVFDLRTLGMVQDRHIIRKEEEFIIYEDALANGSYIMGIDPAEGVGGDSSAICIINIDNPEKVRVVAEYKNNNIQQHELGKLAVKFGRRYNNAYVVPERNIGLLLIQTMLDLGYDYMYKQVAFDEKTQKETKKMGWKTSGANRDLMIDNFIEVWEEGQIELGNISREEMKTFVRKDDGKREHEDRFHDDMLFALFLALIGIRYRIDRSFSFTRL